MRFVVLFSLFAGTAAFAPTSFDRASTSLSATQAVGKPPVKKAAPVTKAATSSGKKNLAFNTIPNKTGLIGDLPPIGFFGEHQPCMVTVFPSNLYQLIT
jgi:hypothetical protein